VSRSLKAHLLLISTTLVWGATFVIIKSALADISPLLFNAIRMSLAAVTLAIVFRSEFRRYTADSVRTGILLGLFLGVGNELQTSGLKLTMPSKAAFLTGLAVVLVPVFLKIFWRRRISVWSALGAIAAFVGLYLLAVPASAGGPDLMSINRGDLLNIGCAIVFAFHIILVGHASQTYRWQQITFVQTVTSAALMSVTAPLLETPHVLWSPKVIWAILVTGLLSLAAAFSVQAWAQQFIPATHAALIFSLEPVFAWITSFLFLGERLGPRGGLGALFILAGVLASEEKGSAESLGVSPDHAGVHVGSQGGENLVPDHLVGSKNQ
jgi:drug/metabolite transporter (DMT)-like permease